MKKRVLKTIFCLSLSAAMLLGDAGAVLADVVSTTDAAVAEETGNREDADLASEASEAVMGDAVFEDGTVGAKIVAAYTLGDVTGLAYDARTGILSWNKVAKATYYRVQKLDAAGEVISSEGTSGVYMNLKDEFYYENDVTYTFKVTAYNYNEAYVVAENLTWEAMKQQDYDFTSYTEIATADGTETVYTLYKYPASVNGAVISTVVGTSAKNSVSALSGIVVKEVSENQVIFSVTPDVLQVGERVEYEVSNNAEFVSDSDQEKFVNSGTIYTNNGVVDEDITVWFSNYDSGDTIYVRAHVYNPSYDYSAVPGQTAENRKSAVVSTTYQVPVSQLSGVNVNVTKDSIRLAPYSTGAVTGYQFQRKNGKKWVNLAQQGDYYTDKGLLADKEYTYRVRGYLYNKNTGKTAYTDWKTVKAITWGSNLNLNANAASKTSAKLTWDKISGAEGYEIYRVQTSSAGATYKDGVSEESFSNETLVKTIKKAKTTSYTDKGLATGNSYSYCVRAYRTLGKTKIYISETAYLTLSGKGMRIAASYYKSNGQYVVKWNKMTDINGFNVEIYNKSTGKYTAYKTLKANAQSIIFPAVAAGGASVTYRIRPYKGKTFYDGASYTVSPVTAAVKNVKAVQTAEGVKVTWSPVAGADYYRVYRAKRDSYSYDKTTKTYSLGSDAELVYETNFADTSVGLNLAPVAAPEAYVEGTKTYYRYKYDMAVSNAVLYNGQFYKEATAYKTANITGTSVVDKTVTVKSLILKEDDPNYDKNTDIEYVLEDDEYLGTFGAYQKNADYSLKTKDVVKNEGPEAGTEYYYFVQACVKTANGANKNSTVTSSIGYGKSAKVVYTKVAAGKASKVTSAKSSKKATVALKFKKVSGVKGYAVYRSTKKNGTYVQVGTSTGTSFTDVNVVGGKTYYYKVATYKQTENGTYIYSKLSAAKSVKAKK